MFALFRRKKEDATKIADEQNKANVVVAPVKNKDRLETALGYVLITGTVLIGLPFIILYLLFQLVMTPVFYIRHKRSRYQQDFPCKYSWPMYAHIDDEPYTAIKKDDLPVEYFKWCEDYDWGGYFVHKDTLLCFQNPFFFDNRRGCCHPAVR